MFLLSRLNVFQKSILVRGLQKDKKKKKKSLQSITRPMVDNTGNLLHSTFSPWTSTQNITHIHTQDVFHTVVAPSLPTLLRKHSLLALSRQLSLERRRQRCFRTLYFLPFVSISHILLLRNTQ